MCNWLSPKISRPLAAIFRARWHEWGAMLNEAKNVMVSNPEQMIVPGIAVVVLVGAFNMLGDCLRDALDPKAVRQ